MNACSGQAGVLQAKENEATEASGILSQRFLPLKEHSFSQIQAKNSLRSSSADPGLRAGSLEDQLHQGPAPLSVDQMPGSDRDRGCH